MAYIIFFISAILGTLYLITIFKDAIKRKIDLKFYQVALYSLHAYAPTILVALIYLKMVSCQA